MLILKYLETGTMLVISLMNIQKNLNTHILFQIEILASLSHTHTKKNLKKIIKLPFSRFLTKFEKQ